MECQQQKEDMEKLMMYGHDQTPHNMIKIWLTYFLLQRYWWHKVLKIRIIHLPGKKSSIEMDNMNLSGTHESECWTYKRKTCRLGIMWSLFGST